MIKSLSHHAYVLVGGDMVHGELLNDLSKRHKISVKGNQDFFDRVYETFTIDDAREVKIQAETRPMNVGAKKIFILSMSGITIEAQNAMLKLLEEPAEYAHFFIIIPAAHLLLPTVKSRVVMVSGQDLKTDCKGVYASVSVIKSDNKVATFLDLSPAKRLETVKNLLDDISKEKKTAQDAINFVNDLEAQIRKAASSTKTVDRAAGLKDATKSFAAIQTARTYMNDRAPSLKMLLEYVALNV